MKDKYNAIKDKNIIKTNKQTNNNNNTELRLIDLNKILKDNKISYFSEDLILDQIKNTIVEVNLNVFNMNLIFKISIENANLNKIIIEKVVKDYNLPFNCFDIIVTKVNFFIKSFKQIILNSKLIKNTDLNKIEENLKQKHELRNNYVDFNSWKIKDNIFEDFCMKSKFFKYIKIKIFYYYFFKL